MFDKFAIGGKPDLAIAKSFGIFAARQAISGADILVGWSSATLEAIGPAQNNGLKVVIERGSTHIRHQTNVLNHAYAEFGHVFADTDPAMIEREVEEYDAADAIAVPTRYAADTFVGEGVAEDKLMINPYGVDLEQFKPRDAPPEKTRPRILFVGRLGIRKGVPWLLRAFAQLKGDGELHLIGPMEPGFDAILKNEPTDGVVIRGALPAHRLPAEYAAADIFCLPSLEEGFPLTLLQAMASGLPVVATNAAGGGELLDEHQGLIVPPRDAGTLAAALHRLIINHDMRAQLGQAARASATDGHSWRDYTNRAVEHYKKLL